jgi:hypothetical protein
MGKKDDKKDKKNKKDDSDSYLGNDTHTLSKFNDMIKKAQGILTHASKKTPEQEENHLRKKYLEATHNYLTGPEQIEQTFKNYYVYEKGELAYNEEYELILEKRATAIIGQFLQNFRENISNSKILLKSYTSLLVNYQNVSDYQNTLQQENAVLKKKLLDMKADIVTNDRKTYYEDQGIDSLNFYYIMLLVIYIACILGFVVCMIIKQTDVSRVKQILILLFLIAYIFIGVPFFVFLVGIIKKITSMLPKNIYPSL